MNRRLNTLLWALALAALLSLVAVVVVAFSFDMDEFLPYHTIACEQPGQLLSVYQGACNALPTQLFGWEFQRSFNYAGEMSAWLMTPVFLVWHSWWAHAMVGVIALALAGWGLVRSLGISSLYLLSTLAFLPLLFPTIHDTGPIRLALVVMAWTPAALRYILSPGSLIRRGGVGVVLTLSWLAAMENKPFFLFIIPGIALWTVAALHASSGGTFIRIHARGLVSWFIGLSASCLGLLLVLRTDGMTYLDYLRGFPSPNDPLVNAGTAMTFLSDWPFSAQRMLLVYPNVDAAFFKPLQAPMDALPLTAERGAPLALALTLVAILLVAAYVTWAFLRVCTRRGKTTPILLLIAVLALLAGPWASGGGSVHHFVFSQVPVLAVILLAFATFARGPLLAAISLCTLSWLSLLAVLTSGRNPAVGSNVDAIMQKAFDRADSKTVIACGSWGCYHQYAFLDNKPAPVVFAETLQEQAELAHDARTNGRSIIYVCRSCGIEALRESMTPVGIEQFGSSPGGWSAFIIAP